MLGITDPWVAAAFVLCLVSSLLCVIYGAMNWNRGDDTPTPDDRQWAKEEDQLGDEL